MTDETVVADLDEFTYEGVGLYFRASADANAALNLDEGADEGMVAQLAFVDVGGLDDANTDAALDITHRNVQ